MANHAVESVKLHMGQKHLLTSSLKRLNYVMPASHTSYSTFNIFKSILIVMKTDLHREYSKDFYND